MWRIGRGGIEPHHGSWENKKKKRKVQVIFIALLCEWMDGWMDMKILELCSIKSALGVTSLLNIPKIVMFMQSHWMMLPIIARKVFF